jgi:hypothetical protein
MSKCQMNKYRPGGRCGGEPNRSETNPEFDSSLSRLLQQRDQLDAMMKPVVIAPPTGKDSRITPLTPSAKPSVQIPSANTVTLTVVQKKTYGKDQDIELLLQGDYE